MDIFFNPLGTRQKPRCYRMCRLFLILAVYLVLFVLRRLFPYEVIQCCELFWVVSLHQMVKKCT